ncbi:MAG: FAD-dependent oxidoreductase [Pikeienuella sp.]
MRAVICGGGIAGLTTALCLTARGWDAVVLEQAPKITEVGAGIQLSPNGFRVLAALGLGDEVRRVSYEPEIIEMRMGVSGRRLMSIPMKAIANDRWGAPYLQVHRADLIDVLRNALIAKSPGAVQTGTTVTGYRQSDNRVCAATNHGEIEGDLLIGADGIHSAVRTTMLGAEKPRFTGNVAWRAVVPRDQIHNIDNPPGACIWAGEGRHAVTYPLRRGELINFVGIVEHDAWRSESWTALGRREDATADFSGWHPLIQVLIERADAHFRWALHDRAPLARWSEGNAVLVGDACHPMLPSLAQGACQAMEDAWVLADTVTKADDIPPALRTYEKTRKDRVTRIQRGAAANARLFHKRGALAQAIAYAPIAIASRVAPGVIHGRNDWIYRHDVTAGAAHRGAGVSN